MLALGADVALIQARAPEQRPLGRVHFSVSCSPEAQRSFDTATALLHSLRFLDSEKAYAEIAESEPGCAMAYWGIAMSRLKYPVTASPALDDALVARASLQKAAVNRTVTSRERGYLAAVTRLFADGPASWSDRVSAYERAMGALASQYPDDSEATIFYALALNMAGDNSYENQTRASELLLVALAQQPDHPGIVHYLTYCLHNDGSGAYYHPTAAQRDSMFSGIHRFLLPGFGALALFCGLGMVITMATAPSPSAAASSVPIGGAFTLTAGDGKTVTDETFRGKWLLVYFGYTHCPDVCPTTLNDIAQMLDQLGPLAAKVQPLFITIDPDRDNAAVVDEYVKAFDSRIVGLTGTPAEIAAAAKQYHVYYKKLAPTAGSDYLMEHSAFIYVMGPDGKYVTLFSPQQGQKTDQMTDRLHQLMAESS